MTTPVGAPGDPQSRRRMLSLIRAHEVAFLRGRTTLDHLMLTFDSMPEESLRLFVELGAQAAVKQLAEETLARRFPAAAYVPF